ncbi:MAG: hypothetical protein KC613_10015, partial [Myxococcales bacterium]|nr:hypothetical protein [Myxococcales bacterium]
ARRPAFAARMPRRLLPLPRPLLLLAVRLTESREAWSYTRGMLGRRLEYDTALAAELLGGRWRALDDTLTETIDWLVAHGHAKAPPRRLT